MEESKTIVNTVWYRNTKGDGRIKANELKSNIAIPESLGGSGQGTNPKELLISSATACYIMTLVFMLQTKKLPVAGLIMSTEAINSKEEGFKITHHPQIVLSDDGTEDQVQSAYETMMAADQRCEVGNMLKKADVQIQVEGKVSFISNEDVVSQHVEKYGLDWS